MQTMLWITALLLPAATLPGCDRGRDAAGPESAVRIGFLAAGDRASYVDAAGIAVDEINEAGACSARPWSSSPGRGSRSPRPPCRPRGR